jgi:hypothetical protein
MKRFFGGLLILAVLVICLGFYLGWFSLSTDQDSHQSKVTVTVDRDKIREDEERAKDKMQELRKKVTDKTAKPADKSDSEKDRPPGS